MTIRVIDERMTTKVDAGASVELVASGFEFVEGPVWHSPGGLLVFSDIAGDRMLRWTEADGISTFREPSNMANGNAYDSEGRLVTCEHATSRLTRTELDGSITVLASHYEGKELNSPNDVVVKSDGSVYFTDPDSGRKPFWGVPRDRELSFCGVYRWTASEGLTLLVDDFLIPNGLCFSLDESRLFVNDTKLRHVRVFDLADDGTLTGDKIWVDVGGSDGERPPDGMKIDTEGTLFCTGPGGIHLFDPSGTRLGVIEFPENVANFAWGGPNLKTLFVTASTSLYRVSLEVPGLRSF